MWAKSVNDAKDFILMSEASMSGFAACEIIDIDHDAGQFSSDGGDYIKLLDWLEETGRNYPIRIHSMNPVGAWNIHQLMGHYGYGRFEA